MLVREDMGGMVRVAQWSRGLVIWLLGAREETTPQWHVGRGSSNQGRADNLDGDDWPCVDYEVRRKVEASG